MTEQGASGEAVVTGRGQNSAAAPILPRPKSARRRAKITNSANFGVNGNSSEGRRHRDLVEKLIAEFGDSDLERIREIAQLRVILERERLMVVNDPARSSEDTIRLTNTIERLEQRLRARISARRKAKGEGTAAPGFRAHVAGLRS